MGPVACTRLGFSAEARRSGARASRAQSATPSGVDRGESPPHGARARRARAAKRSQQTCRTLPRPIRTAVGTGSRTGWHRRLHWPPPGCRCRARRRWRQPVHGDGAAMTRARAAIGRLRSRGRRDGSLPTRLPPCLRTRQGDARGSNRRHPLRLHPIRRRARTGREAGATSTAAPRHGAGDLRPLVDFASSSHPCDRAYASRVTGDADAMRRYCGEETWPSGLRQQS